MIGAVAAARADHRQLQSLLDAFPAPVYLTDAEGRVTFFNRACTDFAGRTPVAGEDRWCVTWRLHSEGGAYLPHDQCPMAVAIREKRKLRGLVAVAERPDGTRVLFTPYPTPIFGDDGELEGAVNILIDVTDERQAADLKAQAQRCRRLAQSVSDTRTVGTLKAMAAEYEEKARTLVASGPVPASAPEAASAR
ncbi:MAG: PAS domain-containing protein [Pseudomonadota bacterium]|nr:PAS domain-containing protein [Pseudomonadota bacterium]